MFCLPFSPSVRSLCTTEEEEGKEKGEEEEEEKEEVEEEVVEEEEEGENGKENQPTHSFVPISALTISDENLFLVQ